jgi:hypothetical protein
MSTISRWPGLFAGSLLVTAMTLGSAGCTQATRSPEPPAIEELPIVWQKTGTYSRIIRGTHVVVRNELSLARLPITEVPVDFDTQMVLVVGMGPTPSNEWGVEISRVWREGSQIRVQERTIYPGTERPLGLEPASPWAVVVVPRSDLNVERFVTRVPKGTIGEPAGAR